MTANRVQPYLDDGDLTLYHGDAITVLQSLPAGIAQTCVTSPPYWGLRDYGTGTWTGGDDACDHAPKAASRSTRPAGGLEGGKATVDAGTIQRYRCRCGAQRTDDQLGFEATPAEYVERIVAVFREVRRCLRDDGTLWLNLGDSYVSNPMQNGRSGPHAQVGATIAGVQTNVSRVAGLKPKDLVGIPWRVAFALQADGWYLRSDIIWSKPNPMPESVTDRPTKAHEYLFLFSKQPRYYMDMDAIREPHAVELHAPGNQKWPNGDRNDGDRMDAVWGNPAGRNRRSVWVIPTEPFPEAHFATYPQELVRPCILAGSKPGDLALDPFVGSGTTALVARKHGRRCIGIDLSAEYLAIAAKRTQQLSLLGGAA